MTDIIVSQLWIYPIKSLKGISVDKAQLEKRGFRYDRRWMLVDNNNRFISQRLYPRLALIKQELSDFGISVRAPDMPVLIIPYPDAQVEMYEEVEVICWDDHIKAQHINSAIDNWFSEFLDADCQLVFMPEDCERLVDTDFAKAQEITSFSDGFPLLIICEESLQELNSRVDIELTINRFRPNIVIKGCEPYGEDTLGHFQINGIDFYAVKPCSRCVVTTVNPETGVKESKEPLATLAKFRKKDRKVYFGQNLLHKLDLMADNTIAVGDKVEIIEPSAPLEFD